MIFVTESDLREQFKTQDLKNFKLSPEIKLTPGARQYLLDKGIDLYNEEHLDNQCSKGELSGEEDFNKLIIRMRILHSETLLCGVQFVENKNEIAHEISKISRQILNIIKEIESGLRTESLQCKECTGINQSNFAMDIGDCFEINEFHIQVENNKEIIMLHRLRLLYRCLGEEVKVYEIKNIETKSKVEAFIYEIINTISRLICSLYGGKVCQRP
ncbi:MAG: hypothetical protein ACRDA4_03885 [Filifactoraceae bacterium]